MSLQDKINATRAANEDAFVDVSLYLGTDATALLQEVNDERVALLQKIDAQDNDPHRRLTQSSQRKKIQARLDELDARDEEIRASTANALTVIRVKRMPGTAYATLTSQHPMRLDVSLDLNAGYNVDALTRAALSYEELVLGEKEPRHYAFEVDGDTLTPLTRRLVTDLFDVASGFEINSLIQNVLSLNDYAPRMQVDLAKKAHAASPVNSEPPSSSESA